ncbi:MAG: helix-turn-helix transcriptional regulator, partial [bacterium]
MGRRKHPEPLTPAEQRVLDEIKIGGTNAEIAVRLGLSINTVKYHVANKAVTWRRAAVIGAGLIGVIAILVAVALLLPDRDSDSEPDQIWWFETTKGADRTPEALLIREIVSGREYRLNPSAN